MSLTLPQSKYPETTTASKWETSLSVAHAHKGTALQFCPQGLCTTARTRKGSM